MRRILVTSALPNANGAIHLGHLLEHIQTDIWVRYQRLQGNECLYVCADDTHGTGTMLKAEELGISAEELIDQVRIDHIEDFKDFLVQHDNYHSTHSPENEHYSALIYERLKNAGYIFTKEVEQLYDPEIPPNLDMSVEEYKNNTAPTLNHFYEKLLLLKDKMNTNTGKKLAIQRHQYMENFLEQFYKEWNGER